MPNRLASAKSPYLQKAQNQPVDWYEWGDEAFALAKEQDRPVFLSIGGVWCHWCHVMAHESFENEDIAKMINDDFIAIKVDRDERPDIDRRFQDAVMRITGSAGWPLTAFLTPQGKVFYGGTYFPPEDRWDRPGLKSLIRKLLEVFRRDRDRIEGAAEELYQSLAMSAHMDTKSGEMINLEKAVSSITASLDMTFGGLGTAPKFHHAAAFEFLINQYYFNRDAVIGKGILNSLDAMAKGGIYDHLLGGFFRYSTDEKWMVPHFEKMLYDNAELLKLYSIAYDVFGKELYKTTAQGIIGYYKKYGTDEAGGFYASQDADIGVLDEGGYYTFTSAELARILTQEELKAATIYFGLDTLGRMPHEPTRNVLFLDKTYEAISLETHWPLSKIEPLISSAKRKMLQHRESREMPYIDKTIYSNWNGLMIEAMCSAAVMLDCDDYIKPAEKAALRIINEYYSDGRLMHREGVGGFSEDYIFFSRSLIELYQVTQKIEYLEIAKKLADSAIELFWDHENWGFFDSAIKGPGYLEINLKNIQDTPVRSANGSAGYLLLLLAAVTGETHYIDFAEKALKAFAGIVEDYPSISHSYLISLKAYTKGIYKVETQGFFDQALKEFRPYKLVLKKDVPGMVVCEKETCHKYDSWPPGAA